MSSAIIEVALVGHRAQHAPPDARAVDEDAQLAWSECAPRLVVGQRLGRDDDHAVVGPVGGCEIELDVAVHEPCGTRKRMAAFDPGELRPGVRVEVLPAV